MTSTWFRLNHYWKMYLKNAHLGNTEAVTSLNSFNSYKKIKEKKKQY